MLDLAETFVVCFLRGKSKISIWGFLRSHFYYLVKGRYSECYCAGHLPQISLWRASVMLGDKKCCPLGFLPYIGITACYIPQWARGWTLSFSIGTNANGRKSQVIKTQRNLPSYHTRVPLRGPPGLDDYSISQCLKTHFWPL